MICEGKKAAAEDEVEMVVRPCKCVGGNERDRSEKGRADAVTCSICWIVKERAKKPASAAKSPDPPVTGTNRLRTAVQGAALLLCRAGSSRLEAPRQRGELDANEQVRSMMW